MKTLSLAQGSALDQLGYAVLLDVVGAQGLDRMRAAFENALGRGQPRSRGKESGTRHAAGLMARGEGAFDDVAAHARVLAAVHHVLRRPFRVLQCQYVARDAAGLAPLS